MTAKSTVQRVLTPFARRVTRRAPAVGDPAPVFVARTHEGKSFDVRDARGRYLVLYFYPKAFTRGCTRESKEFRDHFAEIQALGATVVGVSPDSPQLQCEFASHHELPFVLLSDAGDVARAYGAHRSMLPLPKRITFVIDPNGRIAARFHHELDIGRHLQGVLAFLKVAGSRGIDA
jgi:peroxiredoxin Q/BCP